jgi:hypothetical protein
VSEAITNVSENSPQYGAVGRWRQKFPPVSWYLFTRLCGVTFRKAVFFEVLILYVQSEEAVRIYSLFRTVKLMLQQ